MKGQRKRTAHSGRPSAGRPKPSRGSERGPASKEEEKPFSKFRKEHRPKTHPSGPDKPGALPSSLRPPKGEGRTRPVTEEMPLNKYIAQCGICSRRKAAELVKAEKVMVNGKVVSEPATRVTGRETITLEGKRITPQTELIYVLLNKPRGFITTVEDPQERKTVMELVRDAGRARIFPVGRLDRNTSGLLLLTNDGELAQKLSHPSHEVKKVYHAVLDKALQKEDFRMILTGVELEDGLASVDNMEYVDESHPEEVGLEIHNGKNRIVRRIFEKLGYQVEKLDRVMYAGLTKKQLPRGKWRMLTDKEVILLKHFQ